MGHDHEHHDHKKDHHEHSHGKEEHDCDDHDDHHDHKKDHHGHSHEHGDDCHECGPKVLKPSDVSDAPMPEWKMKALAVSDPSNTAAMSPFGGNWNVETSVSAVAETGDNDKIREDRHDHKHEDNHNHGHSHEHMDDPGRYFDRPTAPSRDYAERAYTVGIGGPVGSGKTALMLQLCKTLRTRISIAAVTNDIFTREDGEFLTKHQALHKDRIMAVETGGCPHAAIREDISANLHACESLTAKFEGLDVVLLESGGDNLAANFSPELADFTVYVIDVAGGDKVPRKGGPGVTQSDILVINKTDLAVAVGADLEVMKRDAIRMRGEGPIVFAQAKNGVGVDTIVDLILDNWKKATSREHPAVNSIMLPLR